MSVGATPSLNFIGDTVDDVAPHSMSEMRGIRFASGNSPTTGPIRLSDFRNQTITLTFDEQAKIQASDKQGSDFFGTVAISENGNTAIVGVSSPITGHAAGAAYIFTRSGTSWTQQQKIQASDKQQDDYFGSSVSISSDGNTALVGASSEDTGGSAAGAAYIFTRSGTSWTQRAKIQASDKQQHDFFGNSVSISSDGNTALVGATYEDTGGTNAGAAYIFARSGTTWSQQAKIQASDKQQNDVFGFSVSISSDGNTALVGAAYKGGYAGAAYIFTRSGTSWTQRAKIQASDKQGSDLFGYSASISGDGNTALVGAIYEDTGGADAGAAYIFTRSGTSWTQQTKIQASDKQEGDNFGWFVSISDDGNTASVGAFREGTGHPFDREGAAYIFTRSGTSWTQKAKIQASDIQGGDQFGYCVGMSGDGRTAIVGAPEEDTGGSNAGAAYIYRGGHYI